MDLYVRLGEELRDLFKDLFRPGKKEVVLSKLTDILKSARLIGGTIAEEAEQLNADVESYLNDPKSKSKIDVMKKHAMRLKHETREI